MNSHDLRNLHALRQLREQRASSQLAAQQQRCRETNVALDDAKEKLRLHRESIAREAEKLYGRFSEGLSINAWHEAQERLAELEDDNQQLQSGVAEVTQLLDGQEQEREVFRIARAARQRQADAWQVLVDGREQGERRENEQREEADDLFAPLSALLSGGAP
jgi:flagellar biosynthesis chaperone FliJ